MADRYDRPFTQLLFRVLPALLAALTGAQDTLTLGNAIENVLGRNHAVQAADRDLTAARQEMRQASRRPNPELEFETENLGAAETRLKLSQPLEFGGKRRARMAAARTDSLAAAVEFHATRAALVAETHRRFYFALGLQLQMEQLDSLVLFAESTRIVIEKQTESGRAGRTEQLRSAKDLTLLNMERHALRLGYFNGLDALGALWGAKPGSLRSVSGELHAPEIPFSRDSLSALLEKSPGLNAARTRITAAEGQEAASRAARIPPMAIEGGVVRDEQSGENRVTLGATLGLPLFNRNTDAVAAAKSATEAAAQRAEAARTDLRTRLLQKQSEMERLEFKTTELKEKVIPQSNEVLAEERRLFAAGRSGYTDLVTAQRELIEAWRDYLTAETEIRLIKADIIELTGQY